MRYTHTSNNSKISMKRNNADRREASNVWTLQELTPGNKLQHNGYYAVRAMNGIDTYRGWKGYIVFHETLVIAKVSWEKNIRAVIREDSRARNVFLSWAEAGDDYEKTLTGYIHVTTAFKGDESRLREPEMAPADKLEIVKAVKNSLANTVKQKKLTQKIKSLQTKLAKLSIDSPRRVKLEALLFEAFSEVQWCTPPI